MQSASYNQFLNKIVFNLPQHNLRQKWQRTVENCFTFKILFCRVNFILAGLLSLLALDYETLTSLAFRVIEKWAESVREVWGWWPSPTPQPPAPHHWGHLSRAGLLSGSHSKRLLAPEIPKCGSSLSVVRVTCLGPNGLLIADCIPSLQSFSSLSILSSLMHVRAHPLPSTQSPLLWEPPTNQPN